MLKQERWRSIQVLCHAHHGNTSTKTELKCQGLSQSLSKQTDKQSPQGKNFPLFLWWLKRKSFIYSQKEMGQNSDTFKNQFYHCGIFENVCAKTGKGRLG